MYICEATRETLAALKTRIDQELAQCRSLEEAGQTFTNLVFETFEESLTILRFFATIPYGALPPAYQSVVDMMVNSHANTVDMQEDSPVLTLLGTRGGEEDLRNTRHAFGIPLSSAEFVDSIPIVSYLLQEIGCDLNWEKHQRHRLEEHDVETESTGFLAGMLYVPDAQHAVDGNGEKLLRVVDQLPLYSMASILDVHTIFGIGGSYITGPYIAAIFFSREDLTKHQVERLMPLANYFKIATLTLASDEKIFA